MRCYVSENRKKRNATQAIAFEWKPCFSPITSVFEVTYEMQLRSHIEYAQLQVHDVDGGDDGNCMVMSAACLSSE